VLSVIDFDLVKSRLSDGEWQRQRTARWQQTYGGTAAAARRG
jgi:hypothetical protein